MVGIPVELLEEPRKVLQGETVEGGEGIRGLAKLVEIETDLAARIDADPGTPMPTSRSSSATSSTRTTTRPMTKMSPGWTSSRSIRLERSRVPLVEPRSSNSTRSPTVTTAWRRETVGLGRQTSQFGSEPMRLRPVRKVDLIVWSSNFATTR